MPAQDFRKFAGNSSDVKDHDNCGSTISRQCFRDAAHSVQRASRCSDGNDGKFRRRPENTPSAARHLRARSMSLAGLTQPIPAFGFRTALGLGTRGDQDQ
jgi:hypothetical protein